MPELKTKLNSKPDIFNQKNIEVFTSIVYYGIKYKLKKPLVCKVKIENNYYYIESKEMQIIAGGKSRKEAIKDFSEDFNHIYKNYNDTPDDKLSERLLKVKININNLVLEVINVRT
jgi:hypothetical protein